VASFIGLESDFNGVKLLEGVGLGKISPVKWPELLRDLFGGCRKVIKQSECEGGTRWNSRFFRSESLGSFILHLSMERASER
jgi:hypothetical protein